MTGYLSLSFYLGSQNKKIDNLGHLGGLMSGCFLALAQFKNEHGVGLLGEHAKN